MPLGVPVVPEEYSTHNGCEKSTRSKSGGQPSATIFDHSSLDTLCLLTSGSMSAVDAVQVFSTKTWLVTVSSSPSRPSSSLTWSRILPLSSRRSEERRVGNEYRSRRRQNPVSS